MINNMIVKIARWLGRLVGYQPRYKTVICDDLPDVWDENSLYLVGDNNAYWMAALVCPCGCGCLIQLALDSTGHPRWKVSINKMMGATLKPSVHRKVGCRSHFFVQEGKIIWCHEESHYEK